ncbi:hypothetical protein E2562_022510 [Oryza meyeriana var. granulata]|uniref:Uncharacterized protein n=1 Tax=Oryza meyeriana var. granulata TaxID=110450 RepID=A0A6G1BN45_9ORYZ|nr:hypothetical protein E2562_022510 [Oryza meyeriana var. granulata]
MSSSPAAAGMTTSRDGVHAGDQQAQASFYGGGVPFQRKIKKARTADEPAAFHVSDAGGAGAEGASGHPDIDNDDVAAAAAGGYSLFTPAPYGQFSSEHFAFAGHGGVSLTLGLPHGAEQTAPFLMSSSNGSDSAGHGVAGAGGYDMNMQSTKSLAAQLMRDFVA